MTTRRLVDNHQLHIQSWKKNRHKNQLRDRESFSVRRFCSFECRAIFRRPIDFTSFAEMAHDPAAWVKQMPGAGDCILTSVISFFLLLVAQASQQPTGGAFNVIQEAQTSGHHGAAAGGQHPRTAPDVQPERGLRQIAAQSAHLCLRETAVAHRDPQTGYHLHRLHGRSSPFGKTTRRLRRSYRDARSGDQRHRQLPAGSLVNCCPGKLLQSKVALYRPAQSRGVPYLRWSDSRKRRWRHRYLRNEIRRALFRRPPVRFIH